MVCFTCLKISSAVCVGWIMGWEWLWVSETTFECRSDGVGVGGGILEVKSTELLMWEEGRDRNPHVHLRLLIV